MAKSIEVVLKLNDRDFTRGIKRANRELDKFQRNVKQTRSSNTQLSGGGQGGFGGLATAVAAFGSAAALSGNNLKTNLRLQKSFGDGIFSPSAIDCPGLVPQDTVGLKFVTSMIISLS